MPTVPFSPATAPKKRRRRLRFQLMRTMAWRMRKKMKRAAYTLPILHPPLPPSSLHSPSPPSYHYGCKGLEMGDVSQDVVPCNQILVNEICSDFASLESWSADQSSHCQIRTLYRIPLVLRSLLLHIMHYRQHGCKRRQWGLRTSVTV